MERALQLHRPMSQEEVQLLFNYVCFIWIQMFHSAL